MTKGDRIMEIRKTDVVIRLHSLETVDGAHEIIDKEMEGELLIRKGGFLLHYKELFEGADTWVDSVIHLSSEECRIQRLKPIKGVLVFHPWGKCKSQYMTPAGLMELETDTKVYEILEEPERLVVHIEYGLKANGVETGYHDMTLDMEFVS